MKVLTSVLESRANSLVFSSEEIFPIKIIGIAISIFACLTVYYCRKFFSNPDYFFSAVNSGSLRRVKFFVANGIDINLEDNNQKTALIKASRRGDFEIVQFLLKVSGIRINHTDSDGWTALMASALNFRIQPDRFKIIHAFLKIPNINISTKDQHGKSLLTHAIERRRNETVRCLIITGAELENKKVLLKRPEILPVIKQAFEERGKKIKEVLEPFLPNPLIYKVVRHAH